MKETLCIPVEHDGALWFHTSRAPRYPAHRHDELELNLVLRGTARYLLDGSRLDLGRGSAAWLHPAQNHVLLDRSPDFEMWILVVRPRLLRRVCTDAASRPLLRPQPVGPACRQLTPAAVRQLDTLFRELAETSSTPALFNAGLGYAVLAAWQAYRAPESVALARADVHPAVEKAARLLRHETAPLPAAELARRCGLSPSRLGALFKQQTGLSVVEFRNRQRLARFHAAHDGRQTMLAAALEAGFGSYAQFHRVYSRLMGRAPGQSAGPRRETAPARPRDDGAGPARAARAN